VRTHFLVYRSCRVIVHAITSHDPYYEVVILTIRQLLDSDMNEKEIQNLMRKFPLVFSLSILIVFAGCSAPQEPRELKYIDIQERALQKAGAVNYFPVEYKYYRTAYWDAKGAYDRENEKFRWFRDYTDVSDQFRLALGKGNKILAGINKINQDKSEEVKLQIASLKDKITSLKQSTSTLNEAWLLRRSLSRAEILLTEAERYHKKGDFDSALTNLTLVNTYSSRSMSIANSILGRYMDKNQLTKWKSMAQETIEESRRRGIVVLIVSKIDQTLMVYKNGKQIGAYDVGLGRNGLKDKLYAGDGATPEGKYRIIKKNSGSRYYKALLFNYPNEEDRVRFTQAKRRGAIPSRVGIGSLVEIHGGGSDGMTRGCISLDNNDMDKLFAITSESTPVTIVGALNNTNDVISFKKEKYL
jgi:L,D-peptidoglycan transpeptidase YkuD (ErfK/YbiS/YcfS/YnhG family)